MSERYMDKARQRGCMRPFVFVACALVGRNTTKYLSPTLVCSFTQSIQNKQLNARMITECGPYHAAIGVRREKREGQKGRGEESDDKNKTRQDGVGHVSPK